MRSRILWSRQPSLENQCAKSTAARSQTQVRHPNESQKIVEAPMNQQDENFRMRGYIRKKAMQSHHHRFSPQTALEMEMDSHGGLEVTIRQTHWRMVTSISSACRTRLRMSQRSYVEVTTFERGWTKSGLRESFAGGTGTVSSLLSTLQPLK